MGTAKKLIQDEFNRVIIKDLGLYNTGKTRNDTGNPAKKRMVILECGKCKKHEKLVLTTKVKIAKICKECSLKKDVKVSDNPLYKKLYAMKARCKTKDSHNSKHYLNKGISVCNEWMSDWRLFESWAMNNGWSEGLEIDRINNDKGYSPDNCRFVGRSTNVQNTSILKSTNTSGYRGVSYHKLGKCYYAYININKKRINLGKYTTPLEGAIAYDTYVMKNNLQHTPNGVL